MKEHHEQFYANRLDNLFVIHIPRKTQITETNC